MPYNTASQTIKIPCLSSYPFQIMAQVPNQWQYSFLWPITLLRNKILRGVTGTTFRDFLHEMREITKRPYFSQSVATDSRNNSWCQYHHLQHEYIYCGTEKCPAFFYWSRNASIRPEQLFNQILNANIGLEQTFDQIPKCERTSWTNVWSNPQCEHTSWTIVWSNSRYEHRSWTIVWSNSWMRTYLLNKRLIKFSIRT
jgi:hypothetical protein